MHETSRRRRLAEWTDLAGQPYLDFGKRKSTLSIRLKGSRFDKGTVPAIPEQPDDEMTDPAGDSGGRIACGVIT
ncbi:MAG TPA: hypothetical protein VJ161_10385, partial [Geobacteraceae bacterium]|nr:hypothetical protein [Geobacteraceae bacterium]